MKKISLKNLNLKEVEQLSREQLKNVLGGYAGGTSPETDGISVPGSTCQCDTDCYIYTGLSNPDCQMMCQGLNNQNCYDV